MKRTVSKGVVIAALAVILMSSCVTIASSPYVVSTLKSGPSWWPTVSFSYESYESLLEEERKLSAVELRKVDPRTIPSRGLVLVQMEQDGDKRMDDADQQWVQLIFIDPTGDVVGRAQGSATPKIFYRKTLTLTLDTVEKPVWLSAELYKVPEEAIFPLRVRLVFAPRDVRREDSYAEYLIEKVS